MQTREEQSATSRGPFGRFVFWMIQTKDPEALRRAGFAILTVALGSGAGLLSSIVHLFAGDVRRAIFTTAFAALLPLVLVILRWKRSPELAIHVALALMLAVAVISPLLSSNGIPIVVGLIAIPIIASVALGVRAAVTWTFIATAVLWNIAFSAPFDVATRTVAWNTTILCGCLGLGSAWMQHARDRTLREIELARVRVGHEATSRAAAELSMRESQALFATVFKRTPSLQMIADLPDGRILDVNKGFVSISGWSAEEAIGKTMTDLDAWGSLEDRDRLQSIVPSSKFSEYIEIRLRRKGGELVHLLAYAEVIQLDGQPRLLAQAIDITDRKRAQDALDEYQKKLEARIEESGEQLRASVAQLEDQKRLVTVGTLAAGIAHQINNPIASITAIAELALLEKEGEGSVGHGEAIEQILDEAIRCGRIVKSVLQFARREPTAKWVDDLNRTVRRAVDLTQHYVDARGGVLKMTLRESQLPVLMSPIELEQVIVNLLRNAVESRDYGARIAITAGIDSNLAFLLVEDDGRGIPSDRRARVLDPFYTTRLGEGGTGLGLSVAHSIVADHRGTLSVDSEPGKGTRFEVRLPLSEGDPPNRLI